MDKQLFSASTLVQIGDGKNSPFWEAKWLLGAAPKDLAPNLYRIARFKNRPVSKELQNSNWIRNVADISDTTQMEEFILLFMALSSVSLNNQPDKITWKWTKNDKYSVASAHECQFLGAFSAIPATRV
jgi:hypothetical protein